jgi:hypothetical protein
MNIAEGSLHGAERCHLGSVMDCHSAWGLPTFYNIEQSGTIVYHPRRAGSENTALLYPHRSWWRRPSPPSQRGCSSPRAPGLARRAVESSKRHLVYWSGVLDTCTMKYTKRCLNYSRARGCPGRRAGRRSPRGRSSRAGRPDRGARLTRLAQTLGQL